jgi:hypothetical protein
MRRFDSAPRLQFSQAVGFITAIRESSYAWRRAATVRESPEIGNRYSRLTRNRRV